MRLSGEHGVQIDGILGRPLRRLSSRVVDDIYEASVELSDVRDDLLRIRTVNACHQDPILI